VIRRHPSLSQDRDLCAELLCSLAMGITTLLSLSQSSSGSLYGSHSVLHTISLTTMLSKLRIVSINDCYELANLPKLQSFLAKLTPVPSAVLLVGDFLSPSPLSSLDGGKGMVATLRAAGSEFFVMI